MEAQTVASTLDAVTVYSEGAVCVRRAKFSPADGEMPRQLRIAGLPLSMRGNSLRARIVSGPAGTGVIAVHAGFDCDLPPEADIPAERLALEKAEEALQRLELRQELLTEQVEKIAALRPSFPKPKRGDPPREAPVASMLALGEFVEAQLADLDRQQLALRRELEDARNELELRQRRLVEASSARRGERVRVTRTGLVSLSTGREAGPLDLAVEYFVPGARWAPTYELSLDPTLSSGSLRMRATVAQRSGEDWRGVRLSLSTADLDRRVEVPELRSLRIGRAQPQRPRSGWREPPPGLDELFAGFDGARAWPTNAPPAGSVVSERPMTVGASTPASGALDDMVTRSGSITGELDKSQLEGAMDGAAPSAFGGGATAAKVGSVAQATVLRPSPAPPMAAPAPGAARARGGPPPMAPARAMTRSPMKKLARRDEPMPEDAEMAAEEAPAEKPAPPPDEVEPGDALLDFGRLSMAGVDVPGRRGRLVHRPAEWSVDIATLIRLQVQVDVLTLVSLRQREATGPAGLTLPVYAQPVRQSAGSYDYRYDAEHAVDIDSDGTWHTVPVFNADVVLVSEYVCVPSVESRTYRTVRVTNRSRHALLAGPADVKLGSEFLMTVPFPTVPPEGESRVGLGVEEAVKVSRNTRYNESPGGILGGSTALEHTVEIEVANRLNRTVDVEIRERLPVPSDKEIHVDETRVEPGWIKDNDAKDGAFVEGGRHWRCQVAAHGTAKLRAEYVIKIPGGKMLVGGNRRV